MFQLRNILGCFLLCFPLILLALSDDHEQKMHIVADSSTFNYKTGVDTYEGNVRIDQGTTHLTADKLVTSKNAQHKIEKAIAYGTKKLAEYTTVPKQGDKIFHAKANVITFYPLRSFVSLEGNVVVTQGQNSFQGPIISYNMKDQIVTAPASKIGHATIIIEPK